MATILQADTGASDDEVIEATVMDRRWQLVLDCLDAPRSPFAKGTLVGFRARLIVANADRRLLERTVDGFLADAAAYAALGVSEIQVMPDRQPVEFIEPVAADVAPRLAGIG